MRGSTRHPQCTGPGQVRRHLLKKSCVLEYTPAIVLGRLACMGSQSHIQRRGQGGSLLRNSRNSGQRWVHRMDGCLDGLHPSNQKARGPCIGARCLTRGESATYQTSCRTPSLQNLEDEHKVSWVEEYQCSIFVPTALHGGTHRCTHTRYCTLHTLPHRPMRRR